MLKYELSEKGKRLADCYIYSVSGCIIDIYLYFLAAFIEKQKSNCRFEQLPFSLSRDKTTRTSDLHVPNVARYQLCYIPC